MSNVTLSIGGRTFVVACAEGEEAHVTKLSRMIDTKLSGMGEMASQSEPRMLLFAALLLADELHEAQSKASPSAESSAKQATPALSENAAHHLQDIATRLENLANHLESEPPVT